MTVVVEEDGSPTAYIKSAPETLRERCVRILTNGEVQELTDEKRQALRDTNDAFAGDALRVRGFACKDIDDPDADGEDLERDLVFVGLQGSSDPPRREMDQAVGGCRDAGIRVVVVAGGDLETAKAIGKEVGFDFGGAMTGSDVPDLGDDELEQTTEDVEVFARVAPDHKLRILALQENWHRVAMTGDGVNDAPGVRDADVGRSVPRTSPRRPRTWCSRTTSS
jgi:Ca2+-transporting ATPase